MTILICDRFKIDPIYIRKQKAREVFLLMRRLNNYYDKEKTNKNINQTTKTVNGKTVIERPAGDNWF
jgi:hypothetical protein